MGPSMFRATVSSSWSTLMLLTESCAASCATCPPWSSRCPPSHVHLSEVGKVSLLLGRGKGPSLPRKNHLIHMYKHAGMSTCSRSPTTQKYIHDERNQSCACFETGERMACAHNIV